MPDRRVDLESRARIEGLERRYRRVAQLLMLSMTGGLVSVVVGLLVLSGQQRQLHGLVGRVQASRVESIQRQCRQRNADHARIVRFVSSLTPRLTGRATAAFPVQLDCAAYARRAAAVKSP